MLSVRAKALKKVGANDCVRPGGENAEVGVNVVARGGRMKDSAVLTTPIRRLRRQIGEERGLSDGVRSTGVGGQRVKRQERRQEAVDMAIRARKTCRERRVRSAIFGGSVDAKGKLMGERARGSAGRERVYKGFE